jgi:hypothetical protein
VQNVPGLRIFPGLSGCLVVANVSHLDVVEAHGFEGLLAVANREEVEGDERRDDGLRDRA